MDAETERFALWVGDRLELIRKSITIRRDEITGANAFIHREALQDIDRLLDQLHGEIRYRRTVHGDTPQE